MSELPQQPGDQEKPSFTDYSQLRESVSSEPEAAQEMSLEATGKRIEHVSARIDELKERYPVESTGHSNFYDVTGNLMGVVKSCFLDWRDYPDDFGDEDRQDLMDSLGPAEQYLKLLEADPDILQKEMTQRDGAFPELRRKADLFKDEGVIDRPITFYIEKASKQVLDSKDQKI